MATNDEKRRMAEILRGGYDVVTDSHGRFWLNGTLFGMNISSRREEVVRCGMNHLADLIDPGLAEVKSEVNEVNGFGTDTKMAQDSPRRLEAAAAADGSVAQVDREALMLLADDMDHRAYNFDATFLDMPMVHAGYLTAYAERIREACGVVALDGDE